MTTSDLIAAGALTIAVLSWLDATRRINAAAIVFRVEQDSLGSGWYRVRNMGTATAKDVQIDASSVSGYELGGSWIGGDIKPGDSLRFTLTSSRGELPDAIGVKFGMVFHRMRKIPFHPVTVESSATSKSND